MSIREYVQDHILIFLLHAVCMLLLSGYLYMTGYPWGNCVLILICWGLVLISWTVFTWAGRNRFFSDAKKILDQTEQRFLLGELMPPSPRLEDRLYRDLIRRSNQSVIERIRRIEGERQEYREFMEHWVHEIKAPVTAISLICENAADERTEQSMGNGTAQDARHPADCAAERSADCVTDRLAEPVALRLSKPVALRLSKPVALRLALENDHIANCVDRVLYYARSDEVYKDYLIRETSLSEVAAETVIKNRRYLILNKASVETGEMDTVYTDGKWISFILTQLLLNSVKYRKYDHVHIRIWTERTAHGVCLCVRDDGIGIRPEDLPRVFEKGFTGKNGRDRKNATGMGLYLCKKLCGKLGIGITAESKWGEGTTIILEFPVSTYVTNL